MASIDEALAVAEANVPICIIDPDTRVISVPSEYKNFGVESDEKVTRVHFQCPKIVGDNIDLTEFNLYINYRNANGELNIYLIDDMSNYGDNVVFSWLLSRHVTAYTGNVDYIVCAKKSDGASITNEWNTKIATGTVSGGLEATKEIEEQNADVIEQILKRLDNDYITQSELQAATDKALAQAKASGEFDGADGAPGRDGAPGVDGLDGHSPVVTATKSGKTTTISVDGADIATVEDGVDGKPGAAGSDGITPHIGDNGNWYIGSTDTGKPSRGVAGAKGSDGAPGQDGAPGANGKDGITPIIGDNGNWYLGNTDTGKPSRGETGPQGQRGEKGEKGDTGPAGPKGDTGGTGPQGPKGDKGDDGQPGENGTDGYSPTTNVTQNDNGATITITDKNGTTTATVTNGKDGIAGSPGKDGYTPVKGTDYFTESDKTELVNAVLAALPAAEGVSY